MLNEDYREMLHILYEEGVDGLSLPVLSLEKVIHNKEATGREKDVLDAKNLRKMSGK